VEFPNATDNTTHTIALSNPDKLLKAKVGNGYVCDSENTLNFANGSGVVKLVNLEVHAFIAPGHKAFDNVENCDMDQVSDIVPIAVGCALAGLVFFVLIAYMIGKRNRQKGYQSV